MPVTQIIISGYKACFGIIAGLYGFDIGVPNRYDYKVPDIFIGLGS